MSNQFANKENLILEGRYLTQQIQLFKARLNEVKQSIELFFPADKTVEEIVCDQGTAVRRVQNDWFIPVENIVPVRKLLGDKYGDFVKEKVEYKTSASLKQIVRNAEDELGQKLRQHVKIKQTVQVTFRPAVSEILAAAAEPAE